MTGNAMLVRRVQLNGPVAGDPEDLIAAVLEWHRLQGVPAVRARLADGCVLVEIALPKGVG